MGTITVLLVCLVISSVAAQKATDEEEAQSGIINGEDAELGEYPFMVRIASLDGEHICGGSLITPRIVLTAAHCVTDESGAKVPVDLGMVVVGDYTTSNVEETEQVVEGMRIIVHEDYHLDATQIPIHDVALIVLKEGVTLDEGGVSTVELPDDDSLYEEGTSVTVIGWGVNSDGSDNDFGELTLADTLQETEMEMADVEGCKQYWKDDYKDYYEDSMGLVGYDVDMVMDELAESNICTIDPAREATAFSGDSGGPIFVRNGNSFTQIGLVSWGQIFPDEKTYNMGVNVFHYKAWIEAAMNRAEEESWLEMSTGGSGGVVLVHNQNGEVKSICNDDVGRDEVGAVCRDQGYKVGVLSDSRFYQMGGMRNQLSEFPEFGYTSLNCKSDAETVMSDCEMEEYKNSEVPCFNGQELAVHCADDTWSFRITRMFAQTKSVKNSQYVKGRVMCRVHAQKYGMDIDLKSHVRVGLVIRKEDGVDEVEENMRYKRRVDLFQGKFKTSDEIKEDACFACIAHIVGTEFYTVAKLGPEDCPDNETHYLDWVRDL